MRMIDRMEETITPLDPGIQRVRILITGLEVCHHKAGRWIDNLLEAIRQGDTDKGLGTRPPGQWHARESQWQTVIDWLENWCDGLSPGPHLSTIEGVDPDHLLEGLGKPTDLKVWQIRRVIAKIRSLIHFPQADEDPNTRYEWLLLDVGAYEADYLQECPDTYKAEEDYWQITARTLINDTVNEKQTELSLGLAIDMLWPCHWDFLRNLKIVLDAIGGNMKPGRPFAACGRNIDYLPDKKQLLTLSNQLWSYSKASGSSDLITTLGEATAEKRWLAASLAKTIQLQVDPPAEMREVSALAGPDWIRS